MNYWLNVHHPPIKNQSQSCHIYLQRKNEHWKDEFKKGDLAFIYETKTSPGRVKVKNARGTREVTLKEEGAGAIIALVKVASDFISYPYEWNNIPFIGHFETQIIKKKLVRRQEINRARSKKGFRAFNPRINGGLRNYPPEEFKAMVKILSF
ncbi:MAG: hypothetical protein E3J75_01480 [Dehalococcoidia bacterium]|nr:MAG: hypothetical protein E3J75_01480 [Dehalococcoidia bacterium]